jgi:hypothetical protein
VDQVAQPPPLPLLPPGFGQIYEKSTQIAVTGVVNGGHFSLSRNGGPLGTFLTWGQRHLVGVNPPCTTADTFSAVQRLCPGDPSSPPGKTGVLPCSSLPAPQIGPVQDGDGSIVVTSSATGAVIQVYVNGQKRGEGGGPVVVLNKPIGHGDVIDVVQNVGSCQGHTAQQVTAMCVAPPEVPDPSTLNLFPVGTRDYNGGKVTVASGTTYTIRGNVYYPADEDGAHTPFNHRLAKLGRVPIAFLVHGRHDASAPSYQGYSFFQTQLARMGIIAVSVDENETQASPEGWTLNVINRADLALASVAYFHGLDIGGDKTFGGRIDFGRTGLMGHSRGAEAVISMTERLALSDVKIRAVLSLAPINSGATTGRPKGYAFMTFLPAADGDVVDNNGAQFYDQAEPNGFRNQLYIDYANHNYFNNAWLNDDTSGGLPVMSRAEHEHMLSAYGCAFFRNQLLGHATTGYLSGTVTPAGVSHQNVHLAYEASKVLIDNYDGHPDNIDSMGQPNTSLGGLVAHGFQFHQGGGSYNHSFFGETGGLVAGQDGTGGEWRSAFDQPRDLSAHEIWVRAAEVYTDMVPPNPSGFSVGLEDGKGTVSWVDVNDVGGLPRPFDRKAFDLAAYYQTDKTKTMLSTLRFPGRCFMAANKQLNVTAVIAVRLRLDRHDKRAIAFDDLEIAAP